MPSLNCGRVTPRAPTGELGRARLTNHLLEDIYTTAVVEALAENL